MLSLTQRLVFSAFALALAYGGGSLAAQTRTNTTPQFKGVLEPVSYTEDIDLTDVFFVTADVGWVAGERGTILRTTDGGTTWEAQLGGDPEASAATVRVLHFSDEWRGWAIQGEGVSPYKTLHTRDGDGWEEIGTAPYGAKHMVFTSPLTGFLAGNPGMAVSGSNVMYRTTDGGRSWVPVWTCEAKVAMGGLTQKLGCSIGQIRFPTPDVGYAVAHRGCTGCGSPPLLAKTVDGGETWTVMVGPGVLEEDEVSGIFFLDEQTGFARLSSKKLHMTTDGGTTWRGIVAAPGEAIQFADPSVGWGVALGWSELRLSYTTDGGKRWTSREMKLPAVTRAFSLPRRDRAYVVGDHGMIFRYRVVPASQAMVANAITAPAMPGFESPLDDQLVELEQVVTQLAEELATADSVAQPNAVASGQSAGNADSLAMADSVAVWSEPFEAPLPPPSDFAASCCKKSFGRLELTLGAISESLPAFIGKYKNLNLLLAAIRMGSDLPDEYRALKGSLRAFRRAEEKESAQAALAGVLDALRTLKQTTAVSMQQQLPEPTTGDFDAASSGSSAPNVMSDAPQNAGTAANVMSAVEDSTKAAGQDAVKQATDKAKKGLGSLLRRKKP
jgi:photosystem II stability/assembly factor-like uncharacterized protein